MDSVRNGHVPHPLARAFDRKQWEIAEPDDDNDRALIASGLAVADLLEAMRPHALRQRSDSTLLRALIAYANQETKHTHTLISDAAFRQLENGVRIENVLAEKHRQSGGTLNELTDALGDSFIYPIRQTMSVVAPAPAAASTTDWREAVEQASAEAVLANRWYLAWFYWMDALWLNSRLTRTTATRWELTPDDREANRRINSFRRQQKLEGLLLVLSATAAGKVASTTKTLECLWVGSNLMLRVRAARGNKKCWSDRIRTYVLAPQYYFSPDVVNLTLDAGGQNLTIGDAVAFFGSLSTLFFDLLPMLPERHAASELHPRDAVCVSIPNIVMTFAEVLELSPDIIETLVEISTFSGGSRETLWGKPFVYIDEGRRFVFLPALKSSLVRTVSHLIDEYAEDHGRKGVFFQEHCRLSLRNAVRSGPLSNLAWVSPRPFHTDARTGDIDILLILGETLVVIEVKFVGFPVDAYEYWKIDQTLDDGVSQLRRKVEFILPRLSDVQQTLERDYAAPNRAQIKTVLPLLLLNDTYHSGFALNDIAVVDMSILVSFLDNRSLESQMLSQNGIAERASAIYRNPEDAGAAIGSYLIDPEVIKRLRGRVVQRDLRYPTHVYVESEEITVLSRGLDVRVDD